MPKVPTAAPAREEELNLPEVPKKAPVVANVVEEEGDAEIASAEVASKRKGLCPPQKCRSNLFSAYMITDFVFSLAQFWRNLCLLDFNMKQLMDYSSVLPVIVLYLLSRIIGIMYILCVFCEHD